MKTDGLSEDHQLVKNNELGCPVCSMVLKNLAQLNHHLDVDHRFIEDGVNSSSSTYYDNLANQGKALDTKSRRVRKDENFMTRAHWKAPGPGNKTCTECDTPLNSTNGCINCRKCGQLFCKAHCKNVIRLNSSAEYDPEGGRWVNCCYKCFSSREGYNEYGCLRDLTDLFEELRRKKNEDKKLRQLQLERRLVRLIDGISKIFKRNNSSLFMSYLNSKDITLLERTVTAWRDDKIVLNCSICSQSFGLMLRKHHCRLCGNIVCDRHISNCSNEVPLVHLANAAIDLPFKEWSPQVVSIEYSMRICSNCIHTLFVERKFRRDLKQPLSALLRGCDSIYDISQVILNVWPQLNSILYKVEVDKNDDVRNTELITDTTKLRKKLLGAVKSYNILTKQILSMSPINTTEKQIQQSFQMASSLFLNEKILKLKTIPMINAEVGQEGGTKEVTPEVHKLSDILFNNLTIKEVKMHREELMVLKEQKFLVESMIENAKRQRKFDELAVLDGNLSEIKAKIEEIQHKLGDQGFS